LRVAIALALAIVAFSASTTLAAGPLNQAGPTPTPPPVFVDPLDPRAGAGANRVGAPLLALVAVVGVGFAAAALTLVYIRVTKAR
jgi:hypothetical protein